MITVYCFFKILAGKVLSGFYNYSFNNIANGLVLIKNMFHSLQHIFKLDN